MKKDNATDNSITGKGIPVATEGNRSILSNEVDELTALEAVAAAALSANTTTNKPQTVLHRAGSRGHASHGWLESHQTFSFADYYNPDRMHFGVLRVLNDDWVAPGMGFGRHPHDNMEIISIPLEGSLEHTDSMGNTAVIEKGDIQVMSAGTGIFHTEYNKHKDQSASFLQIWLFPRKKNVAPRYDQLTLNSHDRQNTFQQILSPNKEDAGVWIHQDAWFHLGLFDKAISTGYQVKKPGNGVYVFVIKGTASIEGIQLNERDGLGVWNTNNIAITTGSTDTEILLMEVPMEIA